MELLFSNKHLILNILRQIKDALRQIDVWNKDIADADDYAISPDGMKTLAATSMLLEAIGEGVKKIDKKTGGVFLILRPEIPWNDVKGIRDHIAHGYFDIDSDTIFDVVKNDLEPLDNAVGYLIEQLKREIDKDGLK